MTKQYEYCQVHRIASKPGYGIARKAGSIRNQVIEGFHPDVMNYLSANGWEQKGFGVDQQRQEVIFLQRSLPDVRKTLNIPRLSSWRDRVKNARGK